MLVTLDHSHGVGVDGARSGWIAVWRHGPGVAWDIHSSARRLRDAHPPAGVIAVDVPIGLSDQGPRTADVEARRYLGGKRACSVFSAPVRGILEARSQFEASARHRQIDGRGFGVQAFGILPKIREWDELLRSDAKFRERVFEVHPEVSFAAMNGHKAIEASKRTVEGLSVRQGLLARHFGPTAVQELRRSVPRHLAAADDVLDALAALWTAERIATRRASSMPTPPGTDSQGLAMAIWY